MSKEIVKKISLVLAIVLLILILVNVAIFFIWRFSSGEKENNQGDSLLKEVSKEETKINCDTDIKEELYEIRGSSLSGLFEPGSKVKVLLNYYQCHQVERGDVVLYKMDSQTDPIIKIVKGIPGDRIGLQGDEKIWNILVNNEIIATSQGEPHQIDKKDGDMLILYMEDYRGGILPLKAHILMGNIVSGSADGTRFGLVDISDIIGKIVYN